MQNITDKKIIFDNIQQMILFSNESKSNQAKIISNILKYNIRTTGKNKIRYVYYYDEELNIWKRDRYCDFIGFFYQFFNNTITEIKKLQIDDEIYIKTIDKICKKFDSRTYILEMSKLILREINELERDITK